MNALILAASCLLLPADASAAGKVAVVTGAASGIGRALAQEAIKRGYVVAYVDKDSTGVLSALSEVGASTATALALTADVSVDADRERVFKEVLARFGGVDLFVSNAGYGYIATTGHAAVEDSRRMFDVNYFAAVDLARRVLALEKKPAAFVVVASVMGLRSGQPLMAQYSASKHALVGWARSAAPEFAGAGVRLKVACPAGTKTGFFKSASGPDADVLRDKLKDVWEDFDAAPTVAKDILDGLDAPGLFIFPGNARRSLSDEYLKALEN